MTAVFYDNLTLIYHLVYADWEKTIRWQAGILHQIIQEEWKAKTKTVLDVACGIGTQALGLAQLGYQLTGSDLSAGEIGRFQHEANKRGLTIPATVADMRHAYDHHQAQFDLVIACDNAIPHLLTDADILQAFRQLHQCVRPGGRLLITVRDYEKESRKTQIKSEKVQLIDGIRHVLFQVWKFDGDIYELSMYHLRDDGQSPCQTEVFRTHYYAVGIPKLLNLLQQAGFTSVKRIDNRFFQPVLIGTRLLEKSKKIQLGTLDHLELEIADDFKMTEEDRLNL